MHKRWLRFVMGGMALVALGACGFHLRGGAQLPAQMQRVYLKVNGGGDLQRELARQLEVSGATLVDAPGPGVAEMTVPEARFSTTALTFTGQARVGEYAVRYHVRFQVRDAAGKVLLPMQGVRVERDFTFDARDPVGTATQTEQLRKGMLADAVQAIMFRLGAAAHHPPAAPVPANAASAAAH